MSVSDSDCEDEQSKKNLAVRIDKLAIKSFLKTTIKLCSIWTNLSSHDLNSKSEEQEMEPESHLIYRKITWDTREEAKGLLREQIITKILKNFDEDTYEFLLQNQEDFSLQNAKKSNDEKNFDSIRYSKFSREKIINYES